MPAGCDEDIHVSAGVEFSTCFFRTTWRSCLREIATKMMAIPFNSYASSRNPTIVNAQMVKDLIRSTPAAAFMINLDPHTFIIPQRIKSSGSMTTIIKKPVIDSECLERTKPPLANVIDDCCKPWVFGDSARIQLTLSPGCSKFASVPQIGFVVVRKL